MTQQTAVQMALCDTPLTGTPGGGRARETEFGADLGYGPSPPSIGSQGLVHVQGNPGLALAELGPLPPGAAKGPGRGEAVAAALSDQDALQPDDGANDLEEHPDPRGGCVDHDRVYAPGRLSLIDLSANYGGGSIGGHKALPPAGVAQCPAELTLGLGVGGAASLRSHAHPAFARNEPGEPGGEVARRLGAQHGASRSGRAEWASA